MRPSLFYTTIFCLLLSATAQAQTVQQVIASGGGTSTALPNYTVDFTIGETVILTAGGDPACTQGFQQPVPATNKKIDSNLLNASWYIKVYPNPVHSQLTVHGYMDHASEIDFRIVDILGRTVLNGRFSFQQGYNDALIDAARLGRGIYVLYLFDEIHNKHQSIKLLKE